jgi:hypothetical protein
VTLALSADRLKLLGKLSDGFAGNKEVVPCVIANLETIPVKLGNLVPCHVVTLVVTKVKSFRHEKRRAKAMLEQDGANDGEVRFDGVVKRKHDKPVGSRLRRDSRWAAADHNDNQQ